MITQRSPAIWLIIFIAGLPLLSETIYTPSMPEIANALHVFESWVEYTLTIYLFGFAIGTLIWGKLSDKYGRKLCLIGGMLVYLVGCLGCYSSKSIEALMFWRFVQAFGGSVGSVLGQAITRDAFTGIQLGRAYAMVGASLALFPALGSFIGGIISQWFDWPILFLVLVLLGAILITCVIWRLEETHKAEHRTKVDTLAIAKQMFTDKKVLMYGLLVAACNGINFSYFAEGSFYLIEQLHMPSSIYGATFFFIALASFLGGMISRKMIGKFDISQVLQFGLNMMILGTLAFVTLLALAQSLNMPNFVIISITICCMMVVFAGVCMVTSNSLSLALADYKHAIGTASSLFGFFYYTLISGFTFVMGFLHNGTLWPMPLYFLGLAVFMQLIFKRHQRKLVVNV